MQPDPAVLRNGRPLSAAVPVDDGAELAALRATCRRQERTIEALGGAVSALRRGAAALKAENAELRAASGRVRRRGREVLDVHLPLDARAPGAGRMVVAAGLRGRVTASVLEDAGLVVSELVANSVRHSGVSGAGVVAVGVRLTDGGVRIEVEDPGRGGAVAARAPDLNRGGGFGLHVVQAISERWGFERGAVDGTRVWAQLARVTESTGPVMSEDAGAGEAARHE